ncbi:hypothetical protein [Brachybacterium sp. AOP29-B2-41]|uniref:hypothetical protein n=1 Tax=Brachybacterium sp. AOP29-B2-41 TaxID=3457704 RepID=UPI004034F3BC
MTFMDDPFAALDGIAGARCRRISCASSKSSAVRSYFITHDVDEAVFLGDRVLVMIVRPGRVALDQEATPSVEAVWMLGEEVRRTRQFVELRERLAGAIEHLGGWDVVRSPPHWNAGTSRPPAAE